MNISDLAGLSEGLTRLIEVVSKGVGSVFAPYLIRKAADAKAYEIRAISDALRDVGSDAGLSVVYTGGEVAVWQKPEDNTLRLEPIPADQRISHRLDYQERKRQQNLENVTATAAANLVDEKSVPEQRPDDDWINRFFASAQDISSEEMQELWGRILAGEIKKPGSYSMRTLDFVRNLTKKEAQVFERLAKMALMITRDTAIVATNDKEWLKNSRGILPVNHFFLSELGLMYPNELALPTFNQPSQVEVALFGDTHLLLLKRGGIEEEIPLQIWKFTDVGKELIPLIDRPLDEEYFEQIGRLFIAKKGTAAIAAITDRLPNGEVKYEGLKEITLEQVNLAPPVTSTADAQASS